MAQLHTSPRNYQQTATNFELRALLTTIVSVIIARFIIPMSLFIYLFHLQIEVIGGADKYMAVCRECFHYASVHEVLAGSPIRNSFH